MNAARQLPIVLLLATHAVFAEEDLEAIYGTEEQGSEEIISLATGYSQPLVRAPAIATVITAEEIEKRGALTLADALISVPGLLVSTARGLSDVFVIRGLFREFNAQVLLLIDGFPINDTVYGGRPQAWSMPIHDIARIEIMRGPGSALYGADAIAGVINVITKTAGSVQGVEMGAYAGRFDTYGGWFLGGDRWEDIDLALYLEAGTTSGYQKIIGADDQTRLDHLLGTTASRAPGALNTQRDDLNARLSLKGARWQFQAGYQGFLNVGTGVGTTLALDPDGDFSVELINADFTYHLLNSDVWTVEAQFSYLGTTTRANLTPYPPGAFAGLFPAGVQDRFQFRTDQERAGLTAMYEGIRNHRVRMGAGINAAAVSDVEEQRNFVTGPNGIPLPAGRLTDVRALGEPLFISEQDRTDLYGFLQDEWRFAPDWTLTAGVRIDHYSDFGTTVNPRLSLVWNVSPRLTAKLLYGRAFRAPSFTELYSNNAALLGNSDLKPETINTVELGLTQHWNPRLWTGINLFAYDLDQHIRGERNSNTPAEPSRVVNAAGIRGYGLELEAGYQLTPALNLAANYAFQTAEDQAFDASPGLAPEQQGYGELNWRITPDWSLNTYLKWVGERARPPGDERDALDDYTLVGATLRRTAPNGDWDVRFSVQNLLNTDAREPSLYPASLPDDIPLPGRGFTMQWRWRFQ